MDNILDDGKIEDPWFRLLLLYRAKYLSKENSVVQIFHIFVISSKMHLSNEIKMFKMQHLKY